MLAFDSSEIVIASHGGFGAGGHADGLAAYFDEVNDRGGILGRRVRVESVDIAPGDAVQYLQGLVWALDRDPLAVSAVGGSAVAPEMAERADDACIPNLFWQAVRPVPAPAERAWTVLGFRIARCRSRDLVAGGRSSASAPMRRSAWSRWTTSGAGPSSRPSSTAARSSAPTVSIDVAWHDPATTTLVEPLAAIAATTPDVLVGATAGNPCLVLQVERIELAALARAPVVLPSVCSDPGAYLAPAGDAAANTFFVDAIGAGDTTTELRDRSFWHGWVAGYMIGEAIEAADLLPGGLSRTNLVRAAYALRREHPLLEGAVLEAGPARHGVVSRWSPEAGGWVESKDGLFEVAEGDLPVPPVPRCGWPIRLSVSASGWTMAAGRLAVDADPQITIDGLGRPIAPQEGVPSGMVVVTSADGVEQFGRLFAVDQPCADELVLRPLPWLVEDVATRPGPYEVRADVWLVSDQISAAGSLPDDGRDVVLELESSRPPVGRMTTAASSGGQPRPAPGTTAQPTPACPATARGENGRYSRGATGMDCVRFGRPHGVVQRQNARLWTGRARVRVPPPCLDGKELRLPIPSPLTIRCCGQAPATRWGSSGRALETAVRADAPDVRRRAGERVSMWEQVLAGIGSGVAPDRLSNPRRGHTAVGHPRGGPRRVRHRPLRGRGSATRLGASAARCSPERVRGRSLAPPSAQHVVPDRRRAGTSSSGRSRPRSTTSTRAGSRCPPGGRLAGGRRHPRPGPRPRGSHLSPDQPSALLSSTDRPRGDERHRPSISGPRQRSPISCETERSHTRSRR